MGQFESLAASHERLIRIASATGMVDKVQAKHPWIRTEERGKRMVLLMIIQGKVCSQWVRAGSNAPSAVSAFPSIKWAARDTPAPGAVGQG